MAWTVVGTAGFSTASGASTETKTLPGTPADGDIVVIPVSHNAGGAFAGGGPNSGEGYTELYNSGTADPNTRVYYKVLTSAETEVVIDQVDGRAQAGCIGVYRSTTGIDSETVIDATRTLNDGPNGDPNPESYTTVTDGALRIITGHVDDDAAATDVAAPSGFSDVVAGDTGGGGNDATTMMASREEATAGALDPDAFDVPNGDDNWRATHFAIRPASGGGAASVAVPNANTVTVQGQAPTITAAQPASVTVPSANTALVTLGTPSVSTEGAASVNALSASATLSVLAPDAQASAPGEAISGVNLGKGLSYTEGVVDERYDVGGKGTNEEA